MNLNYNKCTLCPRQCGVNRTKLQTGVCGVSSKVKLARAALHYWEEPCISGTKGSGAVFFSGCSLHCVYCQNEEIAQGVSGLEVEDERLAEIFLELQEKEANNINLVTPGQFLPHVIKAVESARRQGLRLPIVYNTSGYEEVEAIRALDGIVDVYLPDFKYMDGMVAQKYSKAFDYPVKVKAVIAEMVRQQPNCLFYKEGDAFSRERILKGNRGMLYEHGIYREHDDDLLIGKGVIVRHLLLPGQLAGAKQIVQYLYEEYKDGIYQSLMSQYTPLKHVEKYPELNRKVPREEYDELVNYAIDLGLNCGFIQEEDVASESFIPHFDYEGVLKTISRE